MGGAEQPRPDNATTTVTASSDGSEAAYPIVPFLERAATAHDSQIEIGISIVGTEDVSANELDVFLRPSVIDPGDRIEIGVFTSGVGTVETHDLAVFYGDGDDTILDLESPGAVQRNVAITPVETHSAADNSGESTTPKPDGSPTTQPTATGPDYHPMLLQGQATPRTQGLKGTALPGNTDDEPAYIFELNTRPSAPAGTYAIPIVFTYRADSGIKQVKRVPTVQIRRWYRRWAPLLAFLLAAALLSVLLFILL